MGIIWINYLYGKIQVIEVIAWVCVGTSYFNGAPEDEFNTYTLRKE